MENIHTGAQTHFFWPWGLGLSKVLPSEVALLLCMKHSFDGSATNFC